MAKIVVGFFLSGTQAAGTCAEPDIEGKDVFTSKVPLRRILPSFLHCKAAHVKDENTNKSGDIYSLQHTAVASMVLSPQHHDVIARSIFLGSPSIVVSVMKLGRDHSL